ncbi:uncharacterized protein LOC110382065 [Helicoverpa armigera]|uniref:uncharacterized protein LOC110382065 n=1 Tax=Helicoverpa armigera TaxID=29058 RepID=UPI00308328DB
MDISSEYSTEKRCFKCDRAVLKNLNIVRNASNNAMLLWNQFQIFVYETYLELKTSTLLLSPEFLVNDIIFSGNYLVCLDTSGNIHTAAITMKNTTPKSFKLRGTGTMASSLYGKDHILFLKHEANSYFFSLHKLNADLTLIKNAILIYNEQLPTTQTSNKHILRVHLLKENDLEALKKVFNDEDLNVRNKYNLIIVTFDKLSIFGCLFSSDVAEEQVSLLKLYTSPSEISGIEIIDDDELNVMIGLTIGTIITLPLNNLKTPQITHLNIAIHKFLAFNDAILYTDGKSMWKADNMSKDVEFSKFFVKHVKDFIIMEDKIICTTFFNLIYRFSIHDEASYLRSESNDEYCTADKLLNNSAYLDKILEEVNKNEALIEKLNKEKDYITALSLSNRQDVMDNIINHKVIVYESYEDAVTENKNVVLTNNFSEYFHEDSFFFLIKISTTTEHKLSQILSNYLGDLRVHITFATAKKVLKTISIKVADLSKKIGILIPLKTDVIDITEMNVNIKIISNIPGALDAKQKIWTILYRKHVKLHSEHFIKFNLNLKKEQCLKNLDLPLQAQIYQAAMNHHGHLFEFDDVLRNKQTVSKEWHMYVRLPDKYQEVFRNKDHTKHLTSKKVKYFIQQFTSEDFLKSKSNLIFSIGHENVKIEIHNDSFTSPLLKLSGENMKVVLNIRNFFSDLIYCVFANFGPGKEFINLSSYATIENLQKAVQKCITGSSEEEIEPLIEQFERNVIGVLPI